VPTCDRLGLSGGRERVRATLPAVLAAGHQPRLLRALRDAYLEVFPADGIEARLDFLPAGAYLAITCSPRRGIEATLDLAERLSKRRRLRLVPHVSARLVRDAAHLREVLARLEELAVESVFVPAGDVARPAGSFASALALLRAMAEIGHRIADVGVTAYPEGHPLLSPETLDRALAEKQPLATYMVTQMCFDGAATARWLARVRAAGIALPAWIGLPGVVERRKLLATALRIGVGDSARFLASKWELAAKLLARRRYQPDALLEALAEAVEDPALGVAGFHLYSFNRVEATERWRAEAVSALGAA
jgi:methylenetetrahydrofolate reductase (NADPH)